LTTPPASRLVPGWKGVLNPNLPRLVRGHASAEQYGVGSRIVGGCIVYVEKVREERRTKRGRHSLDRNNHVREKTAAKCEGPYR